MWRDSLLVAGKDLRIEARSRVAVSQVAPFGIVALVLFAFALGPDRTVMAKGAPGLFWVAVLFCTVLAVQRSVAVESGDGARDGLRLSGIDPAGLFLGKAAAVAAELVVLEVVLGLGVVVLYGARIEVPWLIVVSGLLGTIGLAATGTLYGALSAGLRVRETLLPFLLVAHRRAGAAGRHPHLAGRPGRRHPPRTPPRGSACSSCSTPSTWPSASSSTAPSTRRHEQLDPRPAGSPATARAARAVVPCPMDRADHRGGRRWWAWP